ncbi:MAG: hypothetical protein KKG33_05835 [candidate division Zixibacteria bacterium]|nr:hypothetical protein [candidate division Zixibacteria bacterium]MBU1471027.1 hypothetical protein [candidate division Zixibacteria bacterium]MBU2625062.1 hypothetical protein [candidate division Zixibacteria bacterium]
MNGKQAASYVVLAIVIVAFAVSIVLKGLLVTVGAFLTLFIFSFLYKDNPYYKFAEHLFVGVSAAYWMCMGFWGTMVPNLFGKLYPPMVGPVMPALKDNAAEPFMLIPLILGILLLLRLSSSVGWISRWALAFIVGTTAGLNLIRYLRSDFIQQINNTTFSLYATGATGFNLGETLSNIAIFVSVMTGLIYFFFSKEHKGAFGVGARTGIIVLMVTFGASFGYTVMARISLLVGRMQFLFGDWLGMMQ